MADTLTVDVSVFDEGCEGVFNPSLAKVPFRRQSRMTEIDDRSSRIWFCGDSADVEGDVA